MRRGKEIAQSCHASMAAIFNMAKEEDNHFKIPLPLEVREWILGNFKKVCVTVDSEAALYEAYNKAKELGIPCSYIVDEGLTEFNGVHTATCAAIGPWTSEVIDPITGHLKLY